MAWDPVITQSFSMLSEDFKTQHVKYQVGFNFVQLPAIVPDGIVDDSMAVDVLFH